MGSLYVWGAGSGGGGAPVRSDPWRLRHPAEVAMSENSTAEQQPNKSPGRGEPAGPGFLTCSSGLVSVYTRQSLLFCQLMHSANHLPCDNGAVRYVSFGCFSRLVLGFDTRQRDSKCLTNFFFWQCPLCLKGVYRVPFADCNTQQISCRVHTGLRRVHLVLGKEPDTSGGYNARFYGNG